MENKLAFNQIALLAMSFLACTAIAEQPKEYIAVNQVGYLVSGYKIATVKSDANTFSVIKTSNNKSVYTGKLQGPGWWLYSGEWIKRADFSSVKSPGHYRLQVGDLTSYDFEISETVYDDIAQIALKYFYYTRASTALEEKYAGKWHRKAGHPDDKVKIHSSAVSTGRQADTIISCPKGWYDAGDYNKYVVNSGIATHTLLSLYEAYPDFIRKVSTNIPESKNDVPDILDEVLWNIEWMMTMQDPVDGGVYHKLTALRFEPVVMPHEAVGDRYVVKKSTAAALNFAAVMAQASRIYKKYEKQFPGLSGKCLDKAIKAYQWAVKNPTVYYTVDQPEGVKTGAYNDRFVGDEFCWAAIELYISTGQDNYYKQSNIDSLPIRTPTWRRVTTLGYASLICNEEKLTSIADIKAIKEKYVAFADHLYKRYTDCDFMITNERFDWGSNTSCMNEAIIEMVAYKFTRDERFLEAAQANLGFILGRNPVNRSFVTGFGDAPPMKIHHRPSQADGIDDPIPGMMVGGPNHQDSWDCGAEAYPNLSRPALAYIDEECSASTNEVAINWNASLVYVLYSISANTTKEF